MENKRVDIMADIETLGTKSDSTVFQVSAIAFDITTGEIYDEFNQLINIETERIRADGNTIKWWLKTDKELLTKLLTDKNAIDSTTVWQNFHSWITTQSDTNKNIYLWGNGILFDNKMIQVQMNDYQLDYPIFYRNDRDLRTLLELASIKSELTSRDLIDLANKDNEEELHLHNALDDCKAQIKLAHLCYKILMR